MNKKRRVIYLILTVVFGIFMIVFGGIDDSPGAQLLGLIAIIVGLLKSRTKNPDSLPKKL